MIVLHALSYVAGTAAFLFVLLSLASGLLYVAEVIEEHSALAKVVGQRLIYGVMLLLVILYFTDGLPLHIAVLCLVSHAVYLQNFSRTWPSISLVSPAFILSCILVVASHFVAFAYFSERSQHPRHAYSYPRTSTGSQKSRWGARQNETFTDVATFFGVCVWLVPFYLFLSLSANDNVLPSSGDSPQTPTMSSAPRYHQRKPSSMLKSALTSTLSLVIRQPRGAAQREGLIASPRASRASSPSLYSPGLDGPRDNLWGSPPLPPAPMLGSPPAPRFSSSSSTTLARPKVPPRRATESAMHNYGSQPSSPTFPPPPGSTSGASSGSQAQGLSGRSAGAGIARKPSMEPLRDLSAQQQQKQQDIRRR